MSDSEKKNNFQLGILQSAVFITALQLQRVEKESLAGSEAGSEQGNQKYNTEEIYFHKIISALLIFR